MRVPLDLPIFKSSASKGEFDAIHEREAFDKIAQKWVNKPARKSGPVE